MMRWIGLDCMILISSVGLSLQFCYNVPSDVSGVEQRFNFERDNEGEVTKCVYINDANNTIEISVNESRKDHDECMDCLCLEHGLSCCGFGKKAGVIDIPEEMELKFHSQCEYSIVNKVSSQTSNGTDKNEALGINTYSNNVFLLFILFGLTLLCAT